MTIPEARDKCKSVIKKAPRDVLMVMILVLASSVSFGLGYLAGLENNQGQGSDTTVNVIATSTREVVVAAKGGTKYYFPECVGASRIADTNKVWFVSASSAIDAGYTLATNCKRP